MPRTLIFRPLSSNKIVGTTATNLIDIPCAELEAIFVTLLNVGTSNLNSFEIQGKANSDGAFVVLRSLNTHYTSPSGILIEASGDLTALVSTTTGWFIFYPKGIDIVRLVATRASGLDNVTVNVGGS